MRRILVPVDSARNGEFAARHVIQQLLRNGKMEIHLLNVQKPFSAHVARFSSRASRQDYHREQGEAALAPIRALLDKHEVAYTTHQAVGDRATRIIDLAHRLHCDEILIATARKHSLARLVEGSATNRVLELTRVPVVVVAGDSMPAWERYGIPAVVAAAIAFAVAD